MTVPEIVASAHISNKTFYDHFPDKHTAFLAAYDEEFASLFAASWAAAAGPQRLDRPRSATASPRGSSTSPPTRPRRASGSSTC